jgi:prepilin-type N-terminal cleavage/methylation domain-containing protein
MNHRRGVSLIELIVVISLLTAVMAFIGRMLYGLIQAEQASARDVLLDRRLADVAIQFREDVHRAETVTVKAGGLQLDCVGPANRVVTYAASADRIVRTDAADDRTAPPLETYRLPGSRPEFRSIGAGDAAAVELVVAHPLPQLLYTPAAPTTGGTVVIRAAPRRYVPPPAGKE